MRKLLSAFRSGRTRRAGDPKPGASSRREPDDSTSPSPDSGRPPRSSPPPRHALTPHAEWVAFFMIALFSTVILIIIPQPYSTLLFVALIIASLTAAVLDQKLKETTPRALVRDTWRELGQILLYRPLSTPPDRSDATLAARRRIPFVLLVAELAIVVGGALSASSDFATRNENVKLPGYEGEWLTSSAYFAAQSLREYGYIPLWQPYFEMGEPLVDNPFSFVLNPISTGPSLILGAVDGIKISVVLYAIFAGLGGWVLGRVLGLGPLGRVLLGLLLVGKGNMHAMIGTGYFQLGVTQAYFPWIIAGTIGTLRFQSKRWPIALTAIMFALLFFAGNIWYTLPMLISMAALTLAHAVDLGERVVDRVALRRLAGAGLLTLGLSAMTLLPIWANHDHIGGHPAEKEAGTEVAILGVVEQYFNGDYTLYQKDIAPGEPQFYYSYVAPLWFVLLIFAVLPVGWRFRYRAMRRLWVTGLLLAGFFTIWGSGGNPVMIWLYEHLPLLDQWRFVGRALAVASFWIAVLVAIRVDSLWQFALLPRWHGAPNRARALLIRMGQAGATLSLVAVSAVAAQQVIDQWHILAAPGNINTNDQACLDWLREENPNKELTVWRHGYDAITAFLDNHVRLFNIEADFEILPEPNTLADLTSGQLMPEYAVVWIPNQVRGLRQIGYDELVDSPNPVDTRHCLYRQPGALYYAFSVPEWLLPPPNYLLSPSNARPETRLRRLPDRVTVWMDDPFDAALLVVQERAYPGWEVRVDGEPAKLEVVGGLIGVMVPSHGGDGTLRVIQFRFRPSLVFAGAAITLATSAFCALYLLNADRHARRFARWLRSRRTRA